MRLFSLIGWPHIKKHRLRYCLLVAGVALGVAVAVALRGGSKAASEEFRDTVTRIAGASQIQVSAGDAGVPVELVERLQSQPGIAAASPVIQALAEDAGSPGSRVLILAIDVTGDGQMRPWLLKPSGQPSEIDPIAFLAQPDSIMVSRSYASSRGLQLGGKLPLETMGGPREFTVRALLDSEEADRIYGGNVVVMDIYGAQQALGRGPDVDWIDIALERGVSLDRGLEIVRDCVGPGYVAAPPAARGEQLEELLATYSSLQNLAGLFAIALGICMIDVAFRLAVAQRRSEIGVLRSLGATRGQIQRVFLIEGALAGALGSSIGLVAGVYSSELIANGLQTIVRGAFGGLENQPRGLFVSWEEVALAYLLGVGVSVVSCWFPAREAGRVNPVEMFQPVHYEQGIRSWRPWPLAVAAVSAAAAYLCAYFSESAFVTSFSFLLLFFAAVLAIPSVTLLLLRPLRPAAARLFGLEGVLALDNILRTPRRTVNTIAVLLLTFAQAILVAGVSRSFDEVLDGWVDSVIQGDLLVSSSGNLSSQWFRFPESIADELAEVEGVARVQAVRSVRVPFRGRPLLLFAGDYSAQSTDSGMNVRAGDWDEMWRRTGAGEAVYISESLAVHEQLAIGDTVTIDAPRGTLRLPVAGIVEDFSDRRGALFLALDVYRRLWGDMTVDKLRVESAAGAPVEQVRAALRNRIGGRYPATIFTREEFRYYVHHPESGDLAQIQFGICLVVAALALANMTLISVTERKHETAVLLAMGALRRQIRASFLIESLVAAGLSLALGLATGALMLLFMFENLHRNIAGVFLEYVFPWSSATWLGGVTLLCGAIALMAAWPALRRTPLAAALDSE